MLCPPIIFSGAMRRCRSQYSAACASLPARANTTRPVSSHLLRNSRVYFSTQTSKSKASSEAAKEHDRRVTEVQAAALQQHRKRRRRPSAPKQSDFQEATKDNESSLSNVKPSELNVIANNIQHWLSKDPQFFNTTMEALNLSSLAPGGGDTTKSSSTSHQHHPLSALVNEYRQLYFASVPDFRAFVQNSPPSSLTPVIEQLLQAGFGDPVWSKRYRRVRGYESRKFQMEQQIARQEQEVRRRKETIQSALQDLEGIRETARRSARDQRRFFEKRARLKAERMMQEEMVQSNFGPQEENLSTIDSFLSWIRTNVIDTPNLTETVPQEEKGKENQVATSTANNDDNDETSPVLFEPNFLPANRQQKRVRAKRDAIRVLEKDLAQAMSELEKLQSRYQALQFPLPLHEYERAQEAIRQARQVICQELASQIRERHAQLIEQYQLLDAKTDLTKPHGWFSYARLDRRKIIFHCGPTNSGKTYNALLRLKDAERGLYLGPLRLLAAEIYEDLTADGVYTNLFTGQERREIPFATHGSATVEMVNLDKDYDVVVIDEVQMISDATRGAAWTKALLGLRCKEIHVCGGHEARTIVEKLADACGDEFEVRGYERFTPLMIESKSMSNDPTKSGCYRNVQPGDCVVAFSRNDIFAIKREIENSTKYKCCVIYGKLPPQTRADQARRFNDPESGYDILVASDAIGMGLNLNIRRIIFNSIFKYNGEEVVRLSHSEIKQISGRAGRRNSPYPRGEVTCRDPRDLKYIEKCLSTDIPQIEKAALLPTSDHIELFSEGLQAYNVGEAATDLDIILRQFSVMATVKGDFFLGRQTEMQTIAKSLKGIPLTLKDAYMMCLSPTSDNSLFLLQNFAKKMARGEVCGLPSRSVPKAAKSFDDLSYLCNIYGDADLFLWLQFKFPPSNAVEHQAALARKETTLSFINEALANTDRLSLQHDYIRTAIRHRAEWEAENGPADLEDPLGDATQNSVDFQDDDEEEEDIAYASFSERREMTY